MISPNELSAEFEAINKYFDQRTLTMNPGEVVWTDNTSVGSTIKWSKFDESVWSPMDTTDRAICKHWFDMFLKNHKGWMYVLKAEDPFFKNGGFGITNGKHTIAQAYPSSGINVTPKLRASGNESIGLDFSNFNMKSFIAWAMGIEPLPEELK